MKRFAFILTLLLAVSWSAGAGAAPSASEVNRRIQSLNGTFATVNKLVSRHTTLLRRMTRYQASIRATRARPAGPARDYKLRRLLAEARSLAKHLSQLDARIRTSQAALIEARRRLLETLAQLQGARKTHVRKELKRTARGTAGRPTVLRVVKTRISPLDGPVQIDRKADLLRDSEDKIRRRLSEIDRVITRLQSRQKLRSISRGVDRYLGLFAEDTSRRRQTRIRPSRPAAADSKDEGAAAPGLNSSHDTDGTTRPTGAYSTGDDSSWSGGAAETGSRGTSSTYAVVLKELLTPATLEALRRAGRSSDPRVRLRALQRVRDELGRAANRLRTRANHFRKRAKTLRQQEHRRRK